MKTTEQEFPPQVTVPPDKGIRVDNAITIERPVSVIFSFWRRFENLSRFMRHIESVTEKDRLHSHWVVKSIGESTVEWDAEIIEERANEMISWRSIPGADVDNAGSVWFTPLPSGHATMVRVSLKYVPPAGKAGALIAKLFGRDADAEIEEDLGRLKSLLETGGLPKTAGSRERQRRVVQKAKEALENADNYIHENPWAWIGSAAATGLLVGLIINWSRKKGPEDFSR